MQDGGPAFPHLQKLESDRMYTPNYAVVASSGMSLRDWFAGQALTKMLSLSEHDGSYDFVAAAVGAYQLADAMLAERTKP